jgi:hypothetical protein
MFKRKANFHSWMCLGTVILVMTGLCACQRSAPIGQLTFLSSDSELVHSFGWAKEQAMAYVFDNDPVGKWYEASLPQREAFCMRDVSHQAMGAHALGLAAWNRNMLLKFAVNISESKDWCTYWEINRYDKPAPVDYRNDKEFWYNLPANFDVLDCCWRMYLWTGDRIYIEDPVFLNFYERTVEDYVERWDLGLGKIMTRARFMNREFFDPEDHFHTCRGIPSYHEGHPGNTQLGIDLLTFQSAAYLAYAEIMDLRQKGGEADIYRKKAKDIRSFIQKEWWDAENKEFCTIYQTDGNYSKGGGLQVILMHKDVLKPGDKMIQNLRHLEEKPPVNIELKSYRILLELSNPQTRRRDYPEVSFAVIGSIVGGLMDIKSDARNRTVSTLSRLTEQTDWAEIDSVPVFGNTIEVRHIGQEETIFTNKSGKTLTWIARFHAEGEELLVDGKAKQAKRSIDLIGNPVLWIKVVVKPGKTHSVEIK